MFPLSVKGLKKRGALDQVISDLSPSGMLQARNLWNAFLLILTQANLLL